MNSDGQFKRTLQERHQAVKSLAARAIASSVGWDAEESAEHAVKFLEACRQLDAIIAAQDKPAWIAQGIQSANAFALDKRAKSGSAFLAWLYANSHAIRAPIVIESESTVDFDKEYDEIRDQAGIPDLFDQMVDALGRIIALDVIDSVMVKDALEKLRVILKSNRKGSHAAVLASVNYAKFVWLTLKGYGKKFGGPAFDAFDGVYQEASTRVEQVNKDFRAATLETLVDQEAILRFIATGVVDTQELESALPSEFRTQLEDKSGDDGEDTSA